MEENKGQITVQEAQALTVNSQKTIDETMQIGYDRIREAANSGLNKCLVPYPVESLAILFSEKYRLLGYSIIKAEGGQITISW